MLGKGQCDKLKENRKQWNKVRVEINKIETNYNRKKSITENVGSLKRPIELKKSHKTDQGKRKYKSPISVMETGASIKNL